MISRYSCDQAARLATIKQATSLQTLGAYTYTVDAAGNRSQVVETSLITSTSGTTGSHNSLASGAVATTTARNSVTAFSGGSASWPSPAAGRVLRRPGARKRSATPMITCTG